MPYVQNGLPFRGSNPLSRSSSHSGALMAGNTVKLKRAEYWVWLVAKGEATDEDAEKELDMKRSSVCSTRDYFVKRGAVEACVVQLGRSGYQQTLWRACR